MAITYDTEYNKAYLRHLFANEYLGKQHMIHNLGFYMWLVREARKHICLGRLVTERNDGEEYEPEIIENADLFISVISFNE
jgi:queuine/archaeosine tRNA-ribosyltransferase